jgi:dihydrolipoamide dehydrogenase
MPMRERRVKVAIIGAGTAGLSAFKEAEKITKDCLLINGGPFGTTCARVGCMPSKVFIQAANDFYQRRFFKMQGIENSGMLTLNRPQTLKYVRSLRDHFVSSLIRSIGDIGDKLVEGYARFVEPNVLDVEGVRIIADSIVIASGSSPRVPEEWRDHRNRILTTDEIFEQDDFTAEMAVIGAGIIGLELGQALKRMDIGVTMIEVAEFIGGLTDPVINGRVVNILTEEFDLFLGHKAELINHDGGLRLTFGQKQCVAGSALVAIGRDLNIKNLGLEDIGVELNEKGIPEFDYNTLQIKNMPIFIAGDVNGYRQILHEAADEGRIAGYNAVRPEYQCFKRRVFLSIAFTEPQIVIVGQRYKDIGKMPHIIGEVNFERQGRSRILHQNKGSLRVYGEPLSGRILGAEMAAPHGEYIGHLLAWMIQKGMTAFEALNMPVYHPTVLEGFRSAIRDLASKVKGTAPQFDLAPCDSLPGESFN